MKTPAQFEHRLEQLVQTAGGTLTAAAKQDLRAQLEDLEREIAMDIRSMSAQFRSRAVSQLGNTQLKTGRVKASADHRLQGEEHARLDPYQSLLTRVKGMISELT